MKKLLIISGPTASGKTALALRVAKKFNGELMSADSRQIYRGMTIVTGKEIDKDIKTWLVDIVNPDEQFSVADYYHLAWEAIKDIWKRGKLPIIVGGTGFYIKALLDGIGTMGIVPDWELRGQLEGLPVEQLAKRLQEVDPKRWRTMNESDRKNPRRLIRAIEIATHSQSLGGYGNETRIVRRDTSDVTAKRNEHRNRLPPHDFPPQMLWVGLRAPFAILYKQIDQRVDERIRMGAVEEAKKLAQEYGWGIPSMTGVGYRELRDYVEGKILLNESIKRWKFAEHEYARKQMTWFKKEKRISWFTIGEKKFQEEVEKKIAAWYIGK